MMYEVNTAEEVAGYCTAVDENIERITEEARAKDVFLPGTGPEYVKLLEKEGRSILARLRDISIAERQAKQDRSDWNKQRNEGQHYAHNNGHTSEGV